VDKKRNIRVGAVSYLNTKPLVYGLQQQAPKADLVFDLPSRVADDLARGRLDVALIPSIEFFQDPTYTIVSDACIACRGPVMSVKLLSRVPIEQIRSLALDEGSRTSVALVRILLEQRYCLAPRLESLPIGSNVTASEADAVLLIGDRAIHPPKDRFVVEWDLGEEWCRWSELPFVFAMWTARAGVPTGEIGEALRQARDSGVAHLDKIAEDEATAVGLSTSECLGYLRDNLYFHLGPTELQGLELFHRLAIELDLAPRDSELRSNDRETIRQSN
jgi:chorismate dehydratase